VRGGSYLVAQPGAQPTLHTFATPPVVDRADRLTGVEAVDAVDAAVRASVRAQMVSDVRIGTFLSGGVDSPLVAAAMDQTAGLVPAFTIGVDDPAFDESAAASAYATHLGLEHHLETIRAADAVDLLDDVADAYSEPFGDYSSFPTMLVSRLASAHVKTVLCGDGGDELFWGYPRFSRVLRMRRWFSMPRAARVAAYAASKPLPTSRRPLRGVLFGSIGEWYLDSHSGLRSTDFRRIAPQVTGRPELELFDFSGRPERDRVAEWMRRNELRYHLELMLLKNDRASMHHSLEVRVPLLGRDVVRVAHRVGVDDCIQGRTGKTVLRSALRRHAPSDLVDLPKRGFSVPMADWLRGPLAPAVHELLVERDPFPNGFFDRAGLRRFCDEHHTGAADRTRGLWNLLALQLWADRHLRPLVSQTAA
jgi:asparagine synthase (glutamine-hydrolysing)